MNDFVYSDVWIHGQEVNIILLKLDIIDGNQMRARCAEKPVTVRVQIACFYGERPIGIDVFFPRFPGRDDDVILDKN